ncbi:VOC family protein [Alkalicoccobacillus porphyridii]|uniref:VOC family protein n=1 Tax=Alkalicoccobacillus porphyridii TaxID=2597270 RepID=A0A553ZT18_9BACI|nr:VOC family protein [Alkalicoccobacillus porphyridii]TSB44614.1 VOC family protein [Alkalicoccobacillus porphyridii]
MIKGIGHTAYTVENMDQSLRFYCEVLGFEKLFELKNEKDEPWIIYLKVCDGQFIELFYGGSKQIETNHSTIGYAHLCLEVDDIHEIANHLKEHGLTLDVEPKQGLDLNHQCWVRDPDGNRIEFMQMHPDAPQNK